MGCLRALLSCCRDACIPVAKRLSDKGIRVQATCVQAANQTEDEFSHRLRGIVFFMKDCVGQHTARARASAGKSSSTGVEIRRNVKKELEDGVPGHFSLRSILRLMAVL